MNELEKGSGARDSDRDDHSDFRVTRARRRVPGEAFKLPGPGPLLTGAEATGLHSQRRAASRLANRSHLCQ